MALTQQSKQKMYIGTAIATTILLIIAIIIWRQFGNPSNNTAAIDQSTSHLQPPTSTPTPTATPTPTPTFTQPPPSVIGYTGQEGQTALELLIELYPATKVTGDGVNQAVVAINGQPAEGQNKIWNFYLNGQLAQVTPAAYQTTPQDQIEWRLEDF